MCLYVDPENTGHRARAEIYYIYTIFQAKHRSSEIQQLPPCLLKTLRTGDADLRFYITTVQDG